MACKVEFWLGEEWVFSVFRKWNELMRSHAGSLADLLKSSMNTERNESCNEDMWSLKLRVEAKVVEEL